MDIKEIKQIIDLMKRSELTEFEIEEENLKLRICRNVADSQAKGLSQPPFSIEHSMVPQAPVPIASHPAPHAPVPAPVDNAHTDVIKSPMVGTFYRASNPETPAFVETNAKVDTESIVCIIEAMKVMNEIQAELKGTIIEILVEDGQPVEFGQPLFKIKKN